MPAPTTLCPRPVGTRRRPGPCPSACPSPHRTRQEARRPLHRHAPAPDRRPHRRRLLAGLEPVSGFFQFDPVNGAKASEETYVWAAFDQNYRLLRLPDEGRPAGQDLGRADAPQRVRRTTIRSTLILDAYNDKRTSITFAVNPRGRPEKFGRDDLEVRGGRCARTAGAPRWPSRSSPCASPPRKPESGASISKGTSTG